MLLPQPTGKLFGRPLLRETTADEGVELRIFQLADQRTLAPSTAEPVAPLGRVIVAAV